MNDDLSRVQKWADKWLIDFSAQKTKALTISNKPDSHDNPPIMFKEQNIEDVSSHVYLGLRLSADLKWHKHITDVCCKARTKLNAMLSLKYKLDRASLQTMYTSFVQSSLEYASAVWGGTYDVDIKNVDKILIDGMRLITGATKRSNINLLYKETGFKDTRTRSHNTMLTLMYKILNGNSPEYLKRIVTVNETGAYNLRNQRSVNVPHTRLETFYKSFVPLTCRLWNTLTTSVKNAPSINTFKQLIKPKFEHKNYTVMANDGHKTPRSNENGVQQAEWRFVL